MKALTRIWMIGLVFVLVFSAVSCAPQPPAEEPAEQAPAEATQPPAAPAEPEVNEATVRVLAMEQAGPTVEEMNAIVAEFNQANPNIKVEIEYVAYDALHDKIITAMAASVPAYDVFLVDDIWYAEFGEKGYVLDVTDRITQEMRDKIFTSAWDITTVNGVVYGMPWLLDEKYFFYNEKLLKDAGFDAPPKTWEELVDQAKVIKEKGIAEYPIIWSWAQAEAAICDWTTLLYGNGGMMMDDAGKVAFNNEQGVATLAWMLQTIDDGVTNPASTSYLEEDVRNVFSQGKAVFALNWVYMYDLVNFNTEQSQVTDQIKMALIPVFQGNEAASSSINGSMGFSVAAKSAYPDAAWAYVQYLTSEDVQNRYSAHLLPMWQTSYEGESLDKLMGYTPANATTVPMFNEQFPFAHVRPKVPFYVEGSKALQLALQLALTKQKSPADALNEAAAKWDELMK